MIEDYLPNKIDILNYQASVKGSRPLRKAKVVMFMGADTPKSVKEYFVYPISRPTVLEPIRTKKPIPWKARPLCPVVEEKYINQYIQREMAKVKHLLADSFGGWYGNDCQNQCLVYQLVQRAVPTSNDRFVQVVFIRSPDAVEGNQLYTVPFHLIIYTPHNGDAYAIKYVFYNGVGFASLQSLIDAYSANTVQKVSLRDYKQSSKVFGSVRRRGPQTVPKGKPPPTQQIPNGNRFTIQGRHVIYMGWSFDLYFRTVSGLELFNVKYLGEDVAFEIGMQSINVLYGSDQHENLFRNYFDEAYLLGASAFPLIRGVDCPHDSVYLDSVIYSPGADTAKVMKDSACVFEHLNSVPLRRHYTDANKFSMPDSRLIVRQIITIANYDYIYDYEFYQNGAVEIKVTPSGYVDAGNNADSSHAFVLNRKNRVVANVHVHSFNFKIDVDVTSTTNRLVSIDMEAEETTNPLSGYNWRQIKMQPYLIATEAESVSHYNRPVPKYYLFQSSQKTNEQGYPKGYRIYSPFYSTLPINHGSPFVDASSWMKSGLAVTVQKETERTTASIYTEGDPFDPVVNFEKFYSDDENIIDKDVVAWVTLVMFHIPSAEDIPVVTTAGKTMSITLAPFNFFNDDPSMTSSDSTVIFDNKTLPYGG